MMSSNLWLVGMQCGIALQMHDFYMKTMNQKFKGIS